jgi:membrane fusion protein (multidrug efflux system)
MFAGGKLKKLLPYLIPLLLLVAVALLYARMQTHRELTHAKTARDNGRPIPVDVVRVAPGQVTLSLPTECVAQANPLIRVSNPLAARPVAHTRVRIGAKVARGDLLLALDDRAETITLKNAQEQAKAIESYVRAEREQVDYFVGVRAEGLGLERDARQAKVEWARATVDLARAQAELRKAESELMRTKVHAPVAGVVMGVAAPGEVAFSRLVGESTDKPSSGALVAIGVIDPIVIECELPEEKLVFLRPGQSVSAAFPSLPGERFEGRLFRIEPVARQDQRTVGVSIELRNPAARLLPGVHGLVEVQERWEGLRIPSVALVNPRADMAQVFVVDEQNKARLRRIGIGGEGGGWVQVLSGLQQGERVVVVGQAGLTEDDTVRVGQVVDGAAARR